MGIEKGEAKGIEDVLNKGIAENFPDHEKVIHIQIQVLF
jgi:hypothetical protein